MVTEPTEAMMSDLDQIVSVIKKAVDGSVPYVSSYGAFLITSESWNELANIAYPRMKRLDDLLKRQAAGEKLTEKEISDVLNGL